MNEQAKRFTAKKRVALDGRVWWCVWDNKQHKFSTLLSFGKYKTRKACNQDIEYQTKLYNL